MVPPALAPAHAVASERPCIEPEHPCRAWSAHAEDLALGLAEEISRWPENPVQRLLAARGELVRVREGCYVPTTHLSSMAARAVVTGCALGGALRSTFVIAGPSAAWVLSGGAPPLALTFLSTGRPMVVAGALIRQAVVRAHDVESIGGCPLTVPGRTATDVLRFGTDEACAVTTVSRLLGTGLLDPEDVERRLHVLSGHPHARRAATRWEAVLAGTDASLAGTDAVLAGTDATGPREPAPRESAQRCPTP